MAHSLRDGNMSAASLIEHFRTIDSAELRRLLSVMPSSDRDQGQYDREENIPAIVYVLAEREPHNVASRLAVR